MRTTKAIAPGNVPQSNVLTISSPSRVHPGSTANPVVISASESLAIATIQPERPRPGTLRGVPMDIPEAESPVSVELDREVGLTLEWPDGTTTRFGVEELRFNCPCAGRRVRR